MAINSESRGLYVQGEKRIRSSKITSVMKNEIRQVLASQPFKLSTMVESNQPMGDYFLSYDWTKKRLQQYILERWGTSICSLSESTCTNLLKELSPSKKMLISELGKIGLPNMWLLANVKICERVGNNEKVTAYYACVAYSWGSDSVYFDVYATRSKYAEFIDWIFTKHITRKSVVFYAESNQRTRRKIIDTFVKHQDKIIRIIRTSTPMDYFINTSVSVESEFLDKDSMYDVKNIYELFESKLPYYDAEGNILDDYENETEQLEDAFADFSQDLQSGLHKIISAVDRLEHKAPAVNVLKEIENSFKRITFRAT